MDAQHAQAAPAPAAPEPGPFLVTARPGSRLADLLDRREAAKAQAAEAEALASTLDAAIKNELTAACQGRTVIDIDSPGRQRMRLAWRTPKRFDSDRFKREQRELYDAYLKWGTGYWELRALKGSGS